MNEFPVILDFRDFRKIISITIDRSKIDMYSFLFFFFFFFFFFSFFFVTTPTSPLGSVNNIHRGNSTAPLLCSRIFQSVDFFFSFFHRAMTIESSLSRSSYILLVKKIFVRSKSKSRLEKIRF